MIATQKSVEDLTTRAREHLARLVSFPTVSNVTNLPLLDWVSALLASEGVVARVLPAPDQRGKANLLARIGPDRAGGVVLSAHTDVVPVEGQEWQTDPFTLREHEGKLYGRGTCDMKGFVACVLALVPEIAKAPLKRPIHIVLSYDEEVGCLGAPHAIKALLASGEAPGAVIVGEPTLMQPISGHKSIDIFETHVRGQEGHSCDTSKGVSAVMTAAHLITRLVLLEAEARERARDSRFDPDWTSVHVGLVSGGTAMNVISRDCRFVWDLRAIPEGSARALPEKFRVWHEREIEPDMHAVSENCFISTKNLASVPFLRPEENSEAERLVRKISGSNRHRYVSYVTEAGQFQEEGLPSVVCGPGSVDQAHKADEFIALSQLSASCIFLRKVVEECC